MRNRGLQAAKQWYKNCITGRMSTPTLTFTTETDILEGTTYEPALETPSLPIKLITNMQEFENKVLALRMEYEIQKPVGIFF